MQIFVELRKMYYYDILHLWRMCMQPFYRHASRNAEKSEHAE